MHEAFANANERIRDADRIEFSDELLRRNTEQDLRELRRDELSCPSDAEQLQTQPLSSSKAAELPKEATEIVRTFEHRYEVTHRSTTGRLIDMLM